MNAGSSAAAVDALAEDEDAEEVVDDAFELAVEEAALDALLEEPPAPHAARPRQQAHANEMTITSIFLFITSPSIINTFIFYADNIVLASRMVFHLYISRAGIRRKRQL